MAGDLLLVTNVNGDFFVQFSKSPFTVATAELSHGAWQIEFGADKYRRSGHGKPPAMFSWFDLPRALEGLPTPSRWKYAPQPDGGWRLENKRSGETLEGRFFP